MGPLDRAKPSNLSAVEMTLCFIATSALSIVFSWRQLAQVIRGELLNPDSYMRLVRLAETLQSGAPVETVARDGTGAGFALHWSHLLDMLLLLLAAPFRLIWPTEVSADWPLPPAVHWAAVASGPLAVGALALAIVWAVSPFADREWRWLVPIATATTPSVLGYGLPGVVHHHVLLAVVTVMVTGWALRSSDVGMLAGWRSGLWAGVGIWLSPETMPFTLMAIGGLGVASTLSPNNNRLRHALCAAGPALLLIVSVALALDPGSDGWAAVAPDRISVLFVALAVAVCVIGTGMAIIDRLGFSNLMRALLGLGLASLVLGGWLAAFLIVLRGAEGAVSNVHAAVLWGLISEMLPVNTAADFLRYLFGGMLGATLAAALAIHRRSLLLGYIALCVVATVGFGAQHRRFATYAGVVAAFALPVAMTLLSHRLATLPTSWAALVRVACQIGFLLLPLIPNLAAVPSSALASMTNGPTCSLADIHQLLAPYAQYVILAQPDETPELLFHSDVRAVGALYHRSIASFFLAYKAWRSGPSATEPDALRATNAALVLACPGRPRSALVSDLPSDTLFDLLNSGHPPPWLELLTKDPASGQTLYGIR
jgi:hypothetical protein